MELTKQQLKKLGRFCYDCGEHFTKKDIDGGRCLSCGSMICAATQARLEKDFQCLPVEVQERILEQIAE